MSIAIALRLVPDVLAHLAGWEQAGGALDAFEEVIAELDPDEVRSLRATVEDWLDPEFVISEFPEVLWLDADEVRALRRGVDALSELPAPTPPSPAPDWLQDRREERG